MLIFCMFHVTFKNHHNIFLARLMGPMFVKHHPMDSLFAENATKLRSKTILESQDSVYDAVEAAHEGHVLAMVEQFERNTTNFL